MEVRSVVSSPYTGYTLEVKIPLDLLPAAVDPARLGLNIFIYDSDTQDKTGQTRLGWSNFNGVQGDPYRWGHATLAGYTPPADRPTTPTTRSSRRRRCRRSSRRSRSSRPPGTAWPWR
jgi:hypothetical protein